MSVAHRVSTWFRVPSGKTIGYTSDIDLDVAGHPFEAEIDGRQVWTSFPDYEKGVHTQGLYDPATNEQVAVVAFRVFAFSFFILDDNATPAEISQEASAAASANQKAATRLVDALRIASPNTGLIGTTLEGERWTLKSGDGEEVEMQMRMPTPNAYIGYPSLPLVLAERVMSDGPDIVSVLMAQATWHMRHAIDPNPQLAVLLSAIACEAHASRLLDEKVIAADADLVRAYYKAAGGRARETKHKYGTLADVLWGRSLAKEHPVTWNNIQALFNTRHQIAHRAALVEPDVAEPLVYHARQAIHWLTLVSGDGDSADLPKFPIV